MRPIELSVAGLHSFREKQTIDFTQLVDGGVFGIFGPTGSGKSSLLDAMTLALYGKVERATGNTQGILNHAENEISVAFTFDLGVDAPKRYRVERVYKRAKNDGLTIGSCRLRFLSGETPEVLADKERDVTQAIKDLLGLTHDDFTRAVVLPQGKFADFLTLKGAERRRMLQRLFHLEKYGDRLNEKIRERVTNTERRLEAIEAEEHGLGDASDAALKTSEAKYREAEQAANDYQKQLNDVKQRFDGAKTQWETQQNLLDYEKQEQTLKNEQAEIEQLRQQLKQAERVSKVMPYVSSFEEAKEAALQAEKSLEIIKQQFMESQKAEQVAVAAYEQAQAALIKKQPEYDKEKMALQQAQRVQADLEDRQKQVSALQEQLQQQLQALQEKRQLQNKLQAKLNEKKEQLQGWQVSRQEIAVTSEQREQVQQALADKQQIKNDEQTFKEWQQRLHEAGEKQQAVKERLDTSRRQYTAILEGLLQSFSRYEAIYLRLAETSSKLHMLQDWLAVKESEREEAYQVAYKHALAQQLTRQLVAGEPCPVCGSTHHTKKAEDDLAETSLQQLEDLRRFYKKCQEWIQQTLQTIGSQQAALEQRVQHIQQLEEGHVPNLKAIPTSDPLPVSEWKQEDLKQWINQTSRELKALKQDVLGIDTSLQQQQSAFRSASTNQTKLESEWTALSEQVNDYQRHVEQLNITLQGRYKAWAVNHVGIEIEDLEQLKTDIQAKDQKLQKLQEAMDQLTRQIDEDVQQHETLEKDRLNLEQRYTETRATWNEINRSREALEQQLQEILQGKEINPFAALDQLEKEWQLLQSNEKEAKRALDDIKQQRFTLEKQYSNAQALFQQAVERKQLAEAQLQEQMAQYKFEALTVIQQGYLSDSAIEALRSRIESFDEQYRYLKKEIERLRKRLGAERLTEEDMKKLHNQVTHLEEQRDQSLKLQAALEKEWQSIKEKNQRFKVLEKEKIEFAERHGQLQKLQAVFRGNSFVEFIAEEQLMQISRMASDRLAHLTHGRYAIEVDTSGGFVIRDDANGGIRRPVSTLSGGETFLTSLALALSLSMQVQLRGEVPLQFFFLDEGFGTLDPELLDTVVTALEKLHTENMAIGVISHVPELRERLPKKIFVEPAEASGRGSRIRYVI
ncbi:nuclease SbcCD subunit C [Pullulanibacillus camelliae]|uniref:Nuclease SbcCD subunit C n=1 Tax=Pullulanibacillus camelliae TaxID=1707096 RepID=A0A8J2YL64_9BACL|nr:SMC family ATPase [Pullulanibacillus camelliae]GGE50226.1 nuclease SbcCD subunit C [Pullulanibacillus camelliae]